MLRLRALAVETGKNLRRTGRPAGKPFIDEESARHNLLLAASQTRPQTKKEIMKTVLALSFLVVDSTPRPSTTTQSRPVVSSALPRRGRAPESSCRTRGFPPGV